MFCRNCGKELVGSPEICLGCGARPLAGRSFCPDCGSPTTALTEYCVSCGSRLRKEAAGGTSGTGALITGGVLTIVNGALGCIGGIFSVALGGVGFVGDTEEDVVVGATFTGVGILLLLLGIVAIIGGSFAVRKRHFGFAIVGAVCGLLSGWSVYCIGIPIGIAAIVLIAISKDKFQT